jgi:phenylpropionate dioxygenase-like ring-hydroxylating dioxygenase large terminal subunit
MSDISTARKLLPANSQLPVDVYFDQATYEKEMRLIFHDLPRYVGHELAVPNVGDFYALPQEAEGRILVRNGQGIELLSNVCRHRQAVMLNGRGNTQNIVCPLHRWTYDMQGQLLGAPHFEQQPCLNLNKYGLQRWNGLLFEGGASKVGEDLKHLGPLSEFNFDGYVLDHVEVHECNYNWKTFIEVYLEDYHVGPFHPGLGQFVSCDDLRWEFGSKYSVQTVGVNDALATAGSPTYKKWYEQLMRFREGKPPAHGAIWLTYYPTLMLEWYPHVLTVSALYPKGPNKTVNVVEFYYPEEIALFEREFCDAQRAAYMETCAEDDEIAERMDAGRKALMERGVNEVGPYQSPMEDGMQHFHEWYRRVMQQPAA